MRHRAVSILLLLWLVPLFTIVAAGHTRGALKLPGSDTEHAALSKPACSLCELMFGGSSGNDKTPSNTPSTPLDPSGTCAICEITGTLLTPAPPDLAPVRLHRLPWPAADLAVVAPAPRPVPRELAGRAPPTA